MVAEIRAAKALTDKPLGVDLLTAMPDRLMTDVEALIREGAAVFAAGLGVPRDVITLCHEHNVLVLSMCGKVRHAIAAVEAGCDIVVAQGTEAGGHTGQVATLPLVPQMVDAVGDRVPVVAAGGIFDGRGLAAALALGADGVWVGTRFIATPEARSAPGYKDALLRTGEDGTVDLAARSPARRCAPSPTTRPATSRRTPTSWCRSPSMLMKSMEGGWMHLGAHEGTAGRGPGPRVLPGRSGRRRDRRAGPRGRRRARDRGRGRAGARPARRDPSGDAAGHCPCTDGEASRRRGRRHAAS